MSESASYVPVLNRGLRIFFSEFVRVSLRHPTQALFFGRTVYRQIRAARLRAKMSRSGLHVPPIAIFSITNACNLNCKGCYAQALRHDSFEELTGEELRRIVTEADAIGISFFVIVGGEPLMRPEILDIARDFPRIIFLLVTNGLLLSEELVARLKKQPNTVSVLSIEGNESETDERRGRGVYERLKSRMSRLRAAGLFFSISMTMTRGNFETITDDAYVAAAVRAGCRLFFYIEYTPIRDGTDDWVITDSQRNRMREIVDRLRKEYSAVFIAVPWDEEESGGCLASGRGFVHINAEGDLEPCPFAPYSDTNLRVTPLKQALRSPFLASMRDNHEQFGETAGGCALWKKKSQVAELLKSVHS